MAKGVKSQVGVLLNNIESCAVFHAGVQNVLLLLSQCKFKSYLAPPTGDLLPGSSGAPIGGSSPSE